MNEENEGIGLLLESDPVIQRVKIAEPGSILRPPARSIFDRLGVDAVQQPGHNSLKEEGGGSG